MMRSGLGARADAKLRHSEAHLEVSLVQDADHPIVLEIWFNRFSTLMEVHLEVMCHRP